MGGCKGGYCGGCRDCAPGTTGDISDAFNRVFYKYDSVTYSIDKIQPYKSLEICGTGIENAIHGKGGKYAETGRLDGGRYGLNGCCDTGDCYTLGFVDIRQPVRVIAVEATEKVGCSDKVYKNLNRNNGRHCNECDNISNGFVEYPKRLMTFNLRACGRVEDDLACKKKNKLYRNLYGKREKFVAKCGRKNCGGCGACNRSSRTSSTN